MTLSLRHHWKKWFKDKVLLPIWLVMMRLLYVQQHLGKINWTNRLLQFVLCHVIYVCQNIHLNSDFDWTEEALCDHIWVLHRDEKKCKKNIFNTYYSASTSIFYHHEYLLPDKFTRLTRQLECYTDQFVIPVLQLHNQFYSLVLV